MKLAICFVVLSSLLFTFETTAQRRLPNGQPIDRAARKLTPPAAAVVVKPESKSSAPAAPAATPSGAAGAAPLKATSSAPPAAPSNSPRVRFEVEADSSVEGKVEFKADTKPSLEKKPPPPACKSDAHDWLARADRSATVLREFLDAYDRSMPIALLNRSSCVAVVPSMKKGGFTVGGQWGRGVMSCRYDNRAWSPPVFFTLTGGSFGLQIGFQFTDLVMIISNRSGVDSLLSNKLELGASAGGTALMMGRNAGISSDVLLDSRVFSYARSRGLFVGLELRGAYLRPDANAHHVLYGERVHVHDILSSEKIANEANAVCYGGVTTFSRALRDISPAKMYYAKVPRARYQQSPPPSAPAAK